MARDYALSSEPRQFSPRRQSGVVTVSRDEDDNLNFHRVVGTEMSWSEMDGARPIGRRTGTVRATAKGITLIECSDGKWFQESNNGIHEMDDRLRCETCAQFICNCRTLHPTISTMSQTLTFEQLALLPHKTPIAAVEGTLISLTQPKNYASGANAGKPFQYGTIKSGSLEHGVKFDGGDATVQPMTRKGQFIRLECKSGNHGLTGVAMDENEYPPGTIKRTIRCTATAVISYPQAGNATQTPPAAAQASSATQTPPARQDAPQASSVRNTGHPESTVEERVAAWLQIAEEVCRQISKPFEGFMEGLSSTDIKEITTGISMSYKGQYGAYQAPVFGNGQFPNRTVDSLVAQHAPEASIQSWRTFINAKSGKKLGDYDDATFVKLSCWAYDPASKITTPEAKTLAANVRMGTVEKGLAKSVFLSLFAAHKGYGTEFDENDLETVAGEQYGKASNNLDRNEWGEMLDKFEAVIADCVTAHSNNDDGVPF